MKVLKGLWGAYAWICQADKNDLPFCQYIAAPRLWLEFVNGTSSQLIRDEVIVR